MFEDIINNNEKQEIEPVLARLNRFTKEQLINISKNSKVIQYDPWRKEIKKLCAELLECYDYIDELRK